MFIKNLTFVLWALLPLPILLGQNKVLINLNTKDGLPSNTIYSMTEDANGRIWFGTKNGAARYDGRDFYIFNSSHGLEDNEILEINHLGNNEMIAVCNLGKFSYGIGDKFYSFEKFMLKSKLAISVFEIPKIYYTNPSIVVNHADNFFINQNGYGRNARAFDVNKRTISDLNSKLKIDTSISVNEIHKIRDNEFLLKVRYTNDSFPFLMIYKNGRSNKLINKFPEIDNIGTNNRLVYLTYKDTVWAYRLLEETHKLEVVNKVVCGYIPHKIAIINHQVIPLNKSGQSIVFDTLLHRVTKKISLNEIDNISDILVDANKNIWISTLTNGAYLLRNLPILAFTSKDGLQSENISAIKAIDTNTILLGDIVGGLYQKNGNKLNLVYQVPHSKLHKFSIIQQIVSTQNKRVLLTNNSSYNVIVLDKKFEFLLKIGEEYPFIKCIRKIDEDNILLGSINSLYLLNLTTKKTLKVDIPDLRYSDILVSRSGDYWISNNYGIYCYKIKENKLYYLGAQYPICKNRASKICETPDGIIWIGTASHGMLGFYEYNLIAHLNQSKGLKSSYIHSIVPYNEALWLATNSNIYQIRYHFEKAKISHIHINNFNGIGNLSIGEINAFEIANSKVFLATSNGLFEINTKNLSTKERINTILTSIKINNVDSPLKNSFRLPYSQNTISLKYIGIAFDREKENTYLYRMLGVHDSFQTTNETIKEYGPLSPGKYKFEVYCADEKGLPLGKKAYLNIVILPAFYQTPWFIGVCILLTSFSLIIIQKVISTHKQKESKRKLEISELEMQAIRAQMNPHFIFNCLNGIQQLINVQDNEKANKYIAKFAKLIRQTLELSKNNTISLSEEIDFLENYLYLEEMRFQDKFDFEIICDSEIDYNQTKIPSMLLQPYVENSIRHGIKYLTNKKGQIIIEFKKKENTILCTITDNGIGRKASAEMKYSNSIEYQSRGTELNQKRIASYNKMNQEKIDLLINDLQNEKGLSIGTQVIITLQIK